MPSRVPAKFATTSAQLRHLRGHHSRLSTTTQKEENTKVHELRLGAGAANGIVAGSTPFLLTQGIIGGRGLGGTGVSQFDNKVCTYIRALYKL